MSSSASAYLVAGVPFKEIGEFFDHEKSLKRFDSETGKPYTVNYVQRGVKLLGDQLPDDPVPNDIYQWAARAYYSSSYWERGIYPDVVLTRYLLEKGWEVPACQDDKDSKCWCPEMFKIVGIQLDVDSFNCSSSFSKPTPIMLESIQTLLDLSRRNFEKIGVEADRVGLYLLSRLS